MKLFYTRRELDEAIHNALINAEKDRRDRDNFDRIEKRLWRIEERLNKLEAKPELCKVNLDGRVIADSIRDTF